MVTTKSIFSDDVVRGTTSVNETRNSRISIEGLKKILGGKELRNVTRGSDSCDPKAIKCSGNCTTEVGTSGTCKSVPEVNFLCGCVGN